VQRAGDGERDDPRPDDLVHHGTRASLVFACGATSSRPAAEPLLLLNKNVTLTAQ
jgi:hypothetical protein